MRSGARLGWRFVLFETMKLSRNFNLSKSIVHKNVLFLDIMGTMVSYAMKFEDK